MEMGGHRSLMRLVQTAAEQNTLEGITDLLRVVTEEMQAWGTLVWLMAPGSNKETGEGRLFVPAYWIPDDRIHVWHELSFDSMVGAVLHSGTPEAIGIEDPRIATPKPKFISESEARYICLAPTRMPDNSQGVLEVYRRDDTPFGEDEVRYLAQIASVFPFLVGNITDRVGFRLLDDVSNIRFQSDESTSGGYPAVFRQVVNRIAQDFACLEVSIFLEDPTEAEGVCRLVAEKRVWEDPWTERTEYKKGQGATGYVYKTGKTVSIVDLAHYPGDQHWIQQQYPGLKWEDSLHIRDRACDRFQIKDPEASPPLSWLCAPIRNNNTTSGAIRCAGSTRNPFYFDTWQAKFLEGVGVRLGAWWENYLKRRGKDQELRGWEALTIGFHAMNRFVQRQLNKHTWDENAFFREAMRLAHQVIPNTDNSDVRLIDGNELYTAAYYGREWDGSSGKNARYTIQPHGSTASYVIAERKGVLVYDNVNDAPYYKPSFPDTRKLILAPIEDGDNLHGVLCIRSKSPRPFPNNVNLIAGLLGQQLGLYHSLASQIRNLQKLEHQNRQMIATQAKTIGDVHHQVKSPIISSYRIAQTLIGSGAFSATQRQELERLRGLCSKVTRVVRNMGMFSDLANQRPIGLNRSLLARQKFVQMLRESCADHQALADPERKITFRLDDKSLDELAGTKDRIGKVLVEADWPLLEQCINNLLDNAAEYSFDHTVVRVWGGVQAKGSELFIAVSNEGLDVKPEEAPKLRQRGYRSREAISATGEGSGIGLWIVDEIMQAHGGRLAVSPTQNGITEVRLVFPITKGVEKLADAQNLVARR